MADSESIFTGQRATTERPAVIRDGDGELSVALQSGLAGYRDTHPLTVLLLVSCILGAASGSAGLMTWSLWAMGIVAAASVPAGLSAVLTLAGLALFVLAASCIDTLDRYDKEIRRAMTRQFKQETNRVDKR